MGLGDSLRKATVEAEQVERQAEEARRLERRNRSLGAQLLDKLGREAAGELRARSAPLTLVAEPTYRRRDRVHNASTARLVALDEVWLLDHVLAITKDGHVHRPGFPGVFPLTDDSSGKAAAFARKNGYATIMGPLRERYFPEAGRQTGEWAVDVFYVEDGVLMYGGHRAEDFFAKLILKLTS